MALKDPSTSSLSLPSLDGNPSERSASAEWEMLFPYCGYSDAWQEVVEHYRSAVDMPSVENADIEVNSREQLLQAAEAATLDTELRDLTWRQILNEEFPLLLLPNEAQALWIVGRQGNHLLAKSRSKIQPISSDIMGETPLMTCVRVKPAGELGMKPKEQPFSIRWFFELYRKNWLYTAQMFMASLLVQVFSLGMPIFYMVIFDRVFGRQNLATLEVMAMGMAVILVFELVLKELRSFVLGYMLKQMDKHIVESFLDKMFAINLQTSGTERMRVFSDLFGALTHVNHVVATTFLVRSLDMAFSLIIISLLFMLDTPLALVAIAPMLPMALVSVWYIPHIKKRQAGFEKEQRQYRLRLSEAVESTETLKSLDAEKAFKRDIKDKFREHILTLSNVPRSDKSKLMHIQTFLTSVGMLCLLYFGAHRVLESHITFGVYMAVNMLSRTIMNSSHKLFDGLVQFQEALTVLHGIRPVYTESLEEPSRTDGIVLDQVEGELQLVDVNFRYSPDSPYVLKEFNLHIQPGQNVILTGRSGSGKTTLIRLLQRLYQPTAGYVLLDNYNLADVELGNLREHIGAAIQRPSIFTGSMRENIALGKPEASLKEIVEAASMAKLDQFLMENPEGLNMKLLPKGVNLSGGQAARVSLARVFLRKPSVLILDEALNALEPALKVAVLQQIQAKYRGKTCIMVTDFIAAHQNADLIVVLHDGQVAEQGTYEELMAKKGYYYHLNRCHIPA